MHPQKSNRSTQNQSQAQHQCPPGTKAPQAQIQQPLKLKPHSQSSQLFGSPSKVDRQKFKSQSQFEFQPEFNSKYSSYKPKSSDYGSKYQEIYTQEVQDFKDIRDLDIDDFQVYGKRESAIKKLSFKIVVIGQSYVGKTSLIQRFVKGDQLDLKEENEGNIIEEKSESKKSYNDQFKINGQQNSQQNQKISINKNSLAPPPKKKPKKQYSATVGVDFSSRAIQVEDTRVQIQIWDTCGHDLFRSMTTSFYRGACGVFLVFALNDRKSFEKIKFWYDQFQESGSGDALVIIIGTKSDLQHQVQMEEGLQLMKKLGGIFYVQTSAQTGQQIQQLFTKTAQLMYKKYKISHRFRVLAQPRKHNNSSVLINNFDNNKSIIKNQGHSPGNFTSRIRLTAESSITGRKKRCC